MWYYVDPVTFARQFGTGCNQIGLTGNNNNIQQNSNLYCNMPAFSCVPGLGLTVNGGKKTAVPCKVAQFFNIASGIYTLY